MKFSNYFGNEIKPEIAYIILALFFGILYIFVVPPFYVQDEVNHFYRAYQLSEGHLLGEKRRSNLYLISVTSIGAKNVAPIKWTQLSPMLVKDKKNNVYIYGFEHRKWKYTKLQSSLFKKIHFPPINAQPIFLQEKDKNPAIYDEIERKGGLYPTALYQTGGFIPTSIVETTLDLMHHLSFMPPYDHQNLISFNKLYKLLFQDLHPEDKTFIDFNNTVLYAPFSYVPQMGGIIIGKFLHLSPTILLYLARLCTFLCSITLIYYALKLMPIIRWGMFLLAIMPLTFWETISASYDSLTNSLSFLLIAVFFYYALTKPKIKALDIGAIFILTSLVSLSKMAYLPLLFLYFIIPKNKIGSLTKYLGIFSCLLCVNMFLVGIWSILVQKTYVPYLYDMNIDPYAQLLYLWHHPLKVFSIVGQYCSTSFNFYYLEQFISMLSFLDHQQVVFISMYFLAILADSFLGSDRGSQLKIGQKIIAGSVFLLNFFVVILLIYISSTDVGAKIVYGMRPRYLLPFMILFFSTLQYRVSFKIDIEYYKSWIYPILSSNMLFITLLVMLDGYYAIFKI